MRRHARNCPFLSGVSIGSWICLIVGLGLAADPPWSLHPLPNPELSIGSTLPATTSHDLKAFAHGTPDGSLVVLTLEDFRLQALRSTDGGTSFGLENVVAGGPGQADVLDFTAVVADDGRLHVVLTVADPAGDVGLALVRSDDVGASWTPPVSLVEGADRIYGPSDPRIVARHGRASVLFRSRDGDRRYVVSSGDRGSTWTAPLRIDPGGADAVTGWTHEIEIDDAGTIHAAFTLAPTDGWPSVWYTRSLDGGHSFEPERNVAQLLAGEHPTSDNPTMAVAGDGSLLIAFWAVTESYSTNLYVLRSGDHGASFETTLVAEDLDERTPPLLVVGPEGVLLLSIDEYDGQIRVHRSADHGASYAPAVVVTDSVQPYSGRQGWPVAARTAEGRWALAWRDDRSGRSDTEIYVSVSDDDGASWGSAVRVDQDSDGASRSLLHSGAMTAVGTDHLFLVYADGRLQSGGSLDLYANGSPAGELDFTTDERRIDVDRSEINPDAEGVAITSDGSDRVYVATTVTSAGSGKSEIYVSSSSDRGRTFGSPRRVGALPEDSYKNHAPALAALPDGKVYVAFAREEPTGAREVRLSRSTDFGQSWAIDDLVLFRTTAPGTIRPQLGAFAGGRVYASWIGEGELYLARSSDSGDTFTQAAVDQDPTETAGSAFMCARDERIWIVYRSREGPAAPTWTAWVVHSSDGGATWSVRYPLGDQTSTRTLAMTCDDTGGATAFWYHRAGESMDFVLGARHHADGIWAPEVELAPPAPTYALALSVHGDGATAVVAYTECGRAIRVNRSSDGGATFLPSRRMDDVTPAPSRFSSNPHLLGDGSGKIWLLWRDGTEGARDAIVVRMSPDHGATWGPAFRLGSESPRGSRQNHYGRGTTLPGGAFFAWAGQRDSFLHDALTSYWDCATDSDADQDGVTFCDNDCNDGDPQIHPDAVELCDRIDNDCDGSVDEDFDLDTDGIGSCFDNCPALANGDQADFDDDGRGDACETGSALSDADNSGRVDGSDLAQLGRGFGSRCGQPRYDAKIDFTHDCLVDGDDLAVLATHFSQTVPV